MKKPKTTQPKLKFNNLKNVMKYPHTYTYKHTIMHTHTQTHTHIHKHTRINTHTQRRTQSLIKIHVNNNEEWTKCRILSEL